MDKRPFDRRTPDVIAFANARMELIRRVAPILGGTIAKELDRPNLRRIDAKKIRFDEYHGQPDMSGPHNEAQLLGGLIYYSTTELERVITNRESSKERGMLYSPGKPAEVVTNMMNSYPAYGQLFFGLAGGIPVSFYEESFAPPSREHFLLPTNRAFDQLLEQRDGGHRFFQLARL